MFCDLHFIHMPQLSRPVRTHCFWTSWVFARSMANFWFSLCCREISVILLIPSSSLCFTKRAESAYHSPLVTGCGTPSLCGIRGLRRPVKGVFSSARCKNANEYRSAIAWSGGGATRCRLDCSRPLVIMDKPSPMLTMAQPGLGSTYFQSAVPLARTCKPGCSVNSIVKLPRSVCGVCGAPRSSSG